MCTDNSVNYQSTSGAKHPSDDVYRDFFIVRFLLGNSYGGGVSSVGRLPPVLARTIRDFPRGSF